MIIRKKVFYDDKIKKNYILQRKKIGALSHPKNGYAKDPQTDE